jgi:hypothetical protein
MKFDTLLNTKEYLHISFLVVLFISFAIGINFNSEVITARSTLVIFAVGLIYYLQFTSHQSTYPILGIEIKGTNYGIVGPLGMVLIVLWLALVDFKTSDIPSKYIGVLMIFTILNALGINSELKDRSEKLIVTELNVNIHKVTLWMFFAILYFIASRYFLLNGSWDWDFDLFDFLRVAF